jgi:hypothetical protein
MADHICMAACEQLISKADRIILLSAPSMGDQIWSAGDIADPMWLADKYGLQSGISFSDQLQRMAYHMGSAEECYW